VLQRWGAVLRLGARAWRPAMHGPHTSSWAAWRGKH